MEKSIIIHPILYVLLCEHGKRYVGITHNLNIRLSQHYDGSGAKWTRLYKPLSVERIIYPATENDIENRITRELMEIYGKDNVRGGSYCKVDAKFCRDCGAVMESNNNYIYCVNCARDMGLIT
jgi:hypothetical protein